METLERSTASFIIRVWLDQSSTDDDEAIWRGHITHVGSGRRVYFDNLDAITAFVAPYLEEWGIRVGPRGPSDRDPGSEKGPGQP